MQNNGSDLEDFNGPVYTALNWIPMWARFEEKTARCNRWSKIKLTCKDPWKPEEQKIKTTPTVFFSNWRRDINPKRLSFFRKTFDTFLYFFTEYHLISYTWSTCRSQKTKCWSWSWSRRCCVPNSIVMFRVSEPCTLQYYYLLSITIDCYQFLLIDNKW